MKIAVLGASGQTGKQIVRLALEQGHHVTALVRTASKMDELKHDNMTVVEADIFSQDSMTSSLAGHESVLSALGFSRSDNPVTGYTESVKVLVASARSNNVKRLVVMTAHFTEPKAAEGHGFFINWVLIPLIRRVLINMGEMEQWLKSEAQDLDWVVVRPPGLTNKQLSSSTVHEELEGQRVDKPNLAMSMPRANVAQFMLAQLTSDTYLRKTVAIAM